MKIYEVLTLSEGEFKIHCLLVCFTSLFFTLHNLLSQRHDAIHVGFSRLFRELLSTLLSTISILHLKIVKSTVDSHSDLKSTFVVRVPTTSHHRQPGEPTSPRYARLIRLPRTPCKTATLIPARLHGLASRESGWRVWVWYPITKPFQE